MTGNRATFLLGRFGRLDGRTDGRTWRDGDVLAVGREENLTAAPDVTPLLRRVDRRLDTASVARAARSRLDRPAFG